MEYQMLMGLNAQKKWDEALQEYMWYLKNPVLDQPKQKWYRGHGIYKVLTPFLGFQTGDNLLLDSSCHTSIVKLATPTEKQVFYDVYYLPDSTVYNRKWFSASMEFTPEQWSWLRELTKTEMVKLMPHISKYIKNNWSFKHYHK